MILAHYKYRMYPTPEQKILLEKTFGCCRFVYNRGLKRKMEHFKTTGKGLSIFELDKELSLLKELEETRWLKEVNSQSLQSSLRNLDAAFTRFFRDKKGFPKFKTKSNRQSFSNPQKTKADFVAGLIKLLKFKEGIKTVFHRTFEGKIKTSTVSRTTSGKYYISILVERDGDYPTPKPSVEEKTVGIDLGIKTYATLSDGTKVENPKFLAKKLKSLRRQQRKLSRKVKGSKNRDKQRKRVATIHEKASNSRQDFLHKLTHSLVENQDYESFAIEDLGIQGMLKDSNKTLARHIGDAAWHTFRTMLEYKSLRKGKNVLVIGRFEPSSRLCTCGQLNSGLTLKDREWTCASCGTTHDRDVLAAKNIKHFAFCKQNTSKDLVAQGLREFTPVETAPSAVVEAGILKAI